MARKKEYNLLFLTMNFLIIMGFFYLFFRTHKLVHIFNMLLFMAIFMFFLTVHVKKIYMTKTMMFLLSIFEFLHLFGSLIVVNGVRLYDVRFFGQVFEYDNVVHFWAGAMLAYLVFIVIARDLKIEMHHSFKFYIIILLIILVLIYNFYISYFFRKSVMP